MSLLFLATTHRVAPGLLTWRAWEALRSATRVLAEDGHPLLPYLGEAGVDITVVVADAQALVGDARAGQVVWIAAPDGDEELMRAVGSLVVASDDPIDIEVLHGSYDLPGARLLDLVSVMDTLRRDCPWDREQTHATLAPYLLEEAYEVLDTIEGDDLGALREELGDVLMQVAFHSVVASERTDESAFTIDDVAAGIVDKLVRRHPHVFGPRWSVGSVGRGDTMTVADADEVNANWEQIKAAERASKNGDEASIFDGAPMGQPALALAAQLQRRAARAEAPAEFFDAGEGLGRELFDLVRKAREQGLDPEAELRAAAREFRSRVQAWERRDAQD
jgi:XTP/dITP diphosphohydrolase